MRPIEELLKLENYNNLEHDEVIALIKFYETNAYQKAYNDAVSSSIVNDNYINNLNMQSQIQESLDTIKNCVVDFKAGNNEAAR